MRPHEFFSDMNGKRLMILLVLGVGLVAGGWWGLGHMFTSGEAQSARERVRRVLDGMKVGGNTDQAIALWYQGSFHLPGGATQFEEAASGFEAWQADKGLGRISKYEISDARGTEETGRLGQATVEVSGTIDGAPFKMRVVQGEPIVWIP